MGKSKKPMSSMPDLNLAPIMNLMVVLIPMLLLSVSFIEIVILETTLPVYSDYKEQIEQKAEKPKLGLSIVIKDDGFTIAGQGGIMKQEDGSSNIPRLSDRTYDYLTLSNVLLKIKEQYPDEWSVIIVPEFNTKFDIIISTMDAAREYVYPDDSADKAKIMFPNVVIGGGII